MVRSRLLAACVAALVSGMMVAACGGGGSGGGTAAGSGGSSGGSSGGTGGGAAGCNPGDAGKGTQLTVPQEPDSGVDTPDGKCWGSIKPTPITNVGNGTIPSGDSTTFKVAWSSKGLYIRAETTEWPLNNAGGSNWWNSDATEFTVSGADDHGGTFDNSNTFQLAITTDGTLQTSGTNGSNANPAPTAKIKINNGKGWVSELFVPWQTLQVSGAKKGNKYQFDIAEDYGDSSGNRTGQVVWAGDGGFYNNTTNWGDITLG